MFDDQPTNSKVPGNLPVGEPEDIFAGTDKSAPSAPSAPASAPPQPMKTAVSTGKLKPKTEIPSSPQSDTKIARPPLGEDIFSKNPKTQVMPESMTGGSKIKGPGLAKNLMIFLIVVIGISILAGGSWLVYSLFIRESPTANEVIDSSEFDTISTESVIDNTEDTNGEAMIAEEESPTTGEVMEERDSNIENRIQEEEVLFGEPIDTDGDNLSDDIELEIGLNPNNPDSDGDGLSDGDEILVWKSNPLNVDTDGDGYSDGSEVQNGYSPIGSGKIFDSSAQN